MPGSVGEELIDLQSWRREVFRLDTGLRESHRSDLVGGAVALHARHELDDLAQLPGEEPGFLRRQLETGQSGDAMNLFE